MIDTHCHLQFDSYADLPEVLDRMNTAAVEKAIVVGVDPQSNSGSINLAHKYDFLYSAVGLHPTDVASETLTAGIQNIASYLNDKNVVAIGEIGLDFAYTRDNEKEQYEVLEQLIELANSHRKPIIFHAREGESELLRFLLTHKPRYGAVIHCFSVGWEIAKQALDQELLLSFTGLITYPKNEHVREVVRNIPHDRIMLETDAPFLPPQALRGKRNEPANVVEVARKVAELWNKEYEYVDQITTSTATQFFDLSA